LKNIAPHIFPPLLAGSIKKAILCAVTPESAGGLLPRGFVKTAILLTKAIKVKKSRFKHQCEQKIHHSMTGLL